MPVAAPAQPLYARVEQLLLDRIRRRHEPGDMLPTQQEIAAETGASLITVKRALAELGRRGLVESVRGRGTVVRRTSARAVEPPVVEDNHAGVSSWTDSIAGLGAEPRTAWTTIDARIPPKDVGRLLRLKARHRSVRITRLRLVDDEPVCLMTNELPLHLVPDLPERGPDAESLYECLARRYGLRPASADEEVSARAATARERAVLGIAAGLVLVIRRQTYLKDGTPLEFGQIVAPASRYRYRVRLVAARGR